MIALGNVAKEIESIRQAGLYKEERIILTPNPPYQDQAGDVINFCANNY